MTTTNSAGVLAVDWYTRRAELRSGMVFRTNAGEIIRLDRTVPGDGTRWYFDSWDNGWFMYDDTIEPGELSGEPLDAAAIAGNGKEGGR